MSRFSGMSPAKRRAWGVALVAFFVLMIGMIGFSEWWAYNVNVPAFQHRGAASPRP